jgi:hypothetical protein
MMMWTHEIERKLMRAAGGVAVGLAIVAWTRINPDGDPWVPGMILGLALLAGDEIKARIANARNRKGNDHAN